MRERTVQYALGSRGTVSPISIFDRSAPGYNNVGNNIVVEVDHPSSYSSVSAGSGVVAVGTDHSSVVTQSTQFHDDGSSAGALSLLSLRESLFSAVRQNLSERWKIRDDDTQDRYLLIVFVSVVLVFSLVASLFVFSLVKDMNCKDVHEAVVIPEREKDPETDPTSERFRLKVHVPVKTTEDVLQQRARAGVHDEVDDAIRIHLAQDERTNYLQSY